MLKYKVRDWEKYFGDDGQTQTGPRRIKKWRKQKGKQQSDS